jgi:hypothetical protein
MRPLASPGLQLILWTNTLIGVNTGLEQRDAGVAIARNYLMRLERKKPPSS